MGLIFLLGWLTGIVVEDGDLSSVDANRRLQMAKSWHSSQPEVLENDRAWFGVKGPDGEVRAWYGPGQAIAMFPSEVLSSWLVRTLGLKGALAEKIQHALVVYSVFPVIAGLGCVAVFLMLQAAGLSEKASLFGAFGLLYGSTFLQYMQVNQENSLLLLCFATSLWTGLRIGHGGGSGYGIALGLSAGFAALIRLTTLAETAAVFFLILILAWKQADGFQKAKAGIGSALGVFSLFLILERIYHHHRFGDWTSTYFKFFKEQWPQLDPPSSFWDGVRGFMVSPSESVWLFDPLAALGVGFLIFGLLRKRIQRSFSTMPLVMDLDQDTFPDLLIGEHNGTISWFEKRAIPPYKFEWVRDSLCKINVSDSFFDTGTNIWMLRSEGMAAPVLADLNHNGEYDLLVGNTTGKVYYYPDFQKYLNDSARWEPVKQFNSLLDSFVTADFQARIIPTVGLLDGDTIPDALFGLWRGGLLGMGSRNIKDSVPIGTSVEEIPLATLHIYPNPAKEELFIQWETNGKDYRDWETDRKSTRLNSSHLKLSRMPSSA